MTKNEKKPISCITEIWTADGRTTYQIRKVINGERIAQYSDSLPEAEAYNAYVNAAKKRRETVMLIEQWRAALNPTPASDTELTPARHQRKARQPVAETLSELAADYGYNARHVELLLEFFDEQPETIETIDDVTARIVRRFPGWLSDELYAKSTAGGIIGTARALWEDAFENGLVERPLFNRKVKPLEPQGGMSRRQTVEITEDPRPWTWSEIGAIARLLPAVYLLAFWIACLAGLRRSEIFGLRLGDWDPVRRLIRVDEQRKASVAKGLGPVKTPSSNRWVPACRMLATAMDTYIEANFGECPENAAAARAWKSQILIVSDRRLRRLEGELGAMNPQSFAKALGRAYDQLGLTPERLGFEFRPVHCLRKFLLTLLFDGVRPLVVSIVGGHRTPATAHLLGAARVTVSHYLLACGTELAEAHEFLDEETEMRLGEVGISDLLEPGGFEGDLLTVEEASKLLGVSEDDVVTLAKDGIIDAFMNDDFKGPVADRGLLVSAPDVHHMAAESARAAADSYCTGDAMELLEVGRNGLYKLAKLGIIREVTVDARSRRGRVRTQGSLPGGGRRFDKGDVDALALERAPSIHRIRHWMKVGETAAVLSCSTDTVRRLTVAGDLSAWRDPYSHREERYYDPQEVSSFAAGFATMTAAEAASRLGVAVGRIEALVKSGELKTAPTLGRQSLPKRFSENGLDEYLRSLRGWVTVELPDGQIIRARITADGLDDAA